MSASIPCTRELEPRLRRGRLLAARAYAPGSAPRSAILLGHWDGGAVVAAFAAQGQPKPELFDAERHDGFPA